MAKGKYPCVQCGRPGDLIPESVGVFSCGYALCDVCRRADARQANAEAAAHEEAMNRETEPHP